MTQLLPALSCETGFTGESYQASLAGWLVSPRDPPISAFLALELKASISTPLLFLTWILRFYFLVFTLAWQALPWLSPQP